MKKVLVYGLGSVLAGLAILLAVAAMQPTQWAIERSTNIQAPPASIWPYLSDLSRFDSWSPYADRDPQMRKSTEGLPGVINSSYSWDGNDEVGAGKMTLVHLLDMKRVDVRLDFERPMKAVNSVAFILSPAADSTDPSLTQVTWSMKGSYEGLTGLVGKTIGLFIDMDQMVGQDFEVGLEKLKNLAERDATSSASTP